MNPIDLDIFAPSFNWQLISHKRNVFQSAYEIIVSNSANSKSEKEWCGAVEKLFLNNLR